MHLYFLNVVFELTGLRYVKWTFSHTKSHKTYTREFLFHLLKSNDLKAMSIIFTVPLPVIKKETILNGASEMLRTIVFIL